MATVTPAVQQAREQIVRMAKEISALADAGGPPKTFFEEFLKRLVTVLAAEAGVVWLQDGNKRLEIVAEVNLQSTGLLDSPEAQQIAQRILGEVLGTGEASVRSPDRQGDTPTKHVLLLAPLSRNKDVVGVVQVFQRPDSPKDARPGYLQFMEQMCGHASRFLTQEQTKAQTNPDDFWKLFELFARNIQRTLDPLEVATTAANDSRQLVQCDRVSVAIRRGSTPIVKAVSGADSVNHRANMVRYLQRLLKQVLKTGEPLLYTGQMDEFPSQIEKPLGEYIQESGSRMIHILPLVAPEPLVPTRDDDSPEKKRGRKQKRKRPYGAIVFEHVSESRPKPGTVERGQMIADHVSASLNNALSHNRIFLLPVWKAFGSLWDSMRGSRLLITVAVTALLVASSVALVVVPWEYRVEAKGKLMPRRQTNIFATWSGQVTDILVGDSDRVEPGQVLVKLRNDELTAKVLAAGNEINEKKQLMSTLEVQREDAARQGRRDEAIVLDGRLQQTKVEIEGATKHLEVLRSQVELLNVRSPGEGAVVTFQLRQKLANRPVERGEVLLEVMEEKGEWYLELELPEHRLGHLLRQQATLKEKALPVEFMVATSTDETFKGKVELLADRINPGQEGTILEIHAEVTPEDRDRLKNGKQYIGAEVRAKISCGQKPLGYVLFGDVIDFVLKYWLLW